MVQSRRWVGFLHTWWIQAKRFHLGSVRPENPDSNSLRVLLVSLAAVWTVCPLVGGAAAMVDLLEHPPEITWLWMWKKMINILRTDKHWSCNFPPTALHPARDCLQLWLMYSCQPQTRVGELTDTNMDGISVHEESSAQTWRFYCLLIVMVMKLSLLYVPMLDIHFYNF